ncbi:hypothetical protein TNCT_27101 [Trichonephila clavata]|uniref:Uncharacterized protein n=1 Tax=Trichonephila clavata TaxID=2740835 RepID=A0A8X6HT77_TRICU|nr:hypothetical protein TNCT_27101 [Trichonephila clavata]
MGCGNSLYWIWGAAKPSWSPLKFFVLGASSFAGRKTGSAKRFFICLAWRLWVQGYTGQRKKISHLTRQGLSFLLQSGQVIRRGCLPPFVDRFGLLPRSP